MIDRLPVGTGSIVRIGHRGAAALAPENTLRAFREAIAHGVDMVEFDVLDLHDGTLVVAHSDDLAEVSHGAARGSVRARDLAELREAAPELPTLDDALAFFADEAPRVGLHVDLKTRDRAADVGRSVAAHGLLGRAIVSSTWADSLRTVAAAAPGIGVGLTYPHDTLSISRRPALWPVVRIGLSTMRATLPRRLPALVARSGAGAVMVQHRLVGGTLVEQAHELGLSVLTWTVDTPTELERVVAAGVDGVITNDPRLFGRLDPQRRWLHSKT